MIYELDCLCFDGSYLLIVHDIFEEIGREWNVANRSIEGNCII